MKTLERQPLHSNAEHWNDEKDRATLSLAMAIIRISPQTNTAITFTDTVKPHA
jgi:hypothetical protein